MFVGPICLGNISKDWLVDNNQGFTGYVYNNNVKVYKRKYVSDC